MSALVLLSILRYSLSIFWYSPIQYFVIYILSELWYSILVLLYSHICTFSYQCFSFLTLSYCTNVHTVCVPSRLVLIILQYIYLLALTFPSSIDLSWMHRLIHPILSCHEALTLPYNLDLPSNLVCHEDLTPPHCLPCHEIMNLTLSLVLTVLSCNLFLQPIYLFGLSNIYGINLSVVLAYLFLWPISLVFLAKC